MLNTFSDEMQARLAGIRANLLYMETFKERMVRLRKRAGFKSQQEAAEAIRCKRGTVGMWEAPSSAVESVGEYLLATARAYKVRPEYLKTGTGDDGYPWSDGPELTEFSKSPPRSQPERIDPEMLAEAARLARARAEAIGFKDLNHEVDAGPLVKAYEYLLSINDSGGHAKNVTKYKISEEKPEGDGSEQRVGRDGEGHRRRSKEGRGYSQG
jgi:hypothetical protein